MCKDEDATEDSIGSCHSTDCVSTHIRCRSVMCLCAKLSIFNDAKHALTKLQAYGIIMTPALGYPANYKPVYKPNHAVVVF